MQLNAFLIKYYHSQLTGMLEFTTSRNLLKGLEKIDINGANNSQVDFSFEESCTNDNTGGNK